MNAVTRSVTTTMLAITLIVGVTPAMVRAQSDLGVSPPIAESSRVRLGGVVRDSLRLLAMEHSTRIGAQSKTRRELGGSFWTDYRHSLRVPRQWSDGDGWLMNYVGHPGHGAAAGYIWLHHDPAALATGNAFGPDYWRSRLRATAWSALYSAQFEFGPMSEASIGNVGMDPATSGWVDHVLTPVGGLAVMAAEDLIDRYVLRRLEHSVTHPLARALLRTALNPARAMANVAGARAPWHRRERALAATTDLSAGLNQQRDRTSNRAAGDADPAVR